MGNVLAASSGASGGVGAGGLGLGLPEPAPLPADSTATSASATSGGDSTSSLADFGAAAKDGQLENPGTVEELHKKCKGRWTSVTSWPPDPSERGESRIPSPH